MKIDKITIGLSIVLAAVVALAVFSASFPAAGEEAVQSADVSVNTTAIKIVCQNGTYQSTYVVSYWNFSGLSGATVVNPTNNLGQIQNTSDNTKPVACLNNTNDGSMDVTINAATFTPDVVSAETFSNVTLGTATTTWYTLTLGVDTLYGTIPTNENKTLWLNVTLHKSGTGTSTFNVTSEV